jgi:hypothetical protein
MPLTSWKALKPDMAEAEGQLLKFIILNWNKILKNSTVLSWKNDELKLTYERL